MVKQTFNYIIPISVIVALVIGFFAVRGLFPIIETVEVEKEVEKIVEVPIEVEIPCNYTIADCPEKLCICPDKISTPIEPVESKTLLWNISAKDNCRFKTTDYFNKTSKEYPYTQFEYWAHATNKDYRGILPAGHNRFITGSSLEWCAFWGLN